MHSILFSSLRRNSAVFDPPAYLPAAFAHFSFLHKQQRNGPGSAGCISAASFKARNMSLYPAASSLVMFSGVPWW